jgi:hypothetical protein
MSSIVKPAFSSTFGVAYAGLFKFCYKIELTTINLNYRITLIIVDLLDLVQQK